MPSSSARCSQLPRAVDKVPFYVALKKFRDHLVGKLPDLEDSEITFPDLELKTAKKEPKEEVKEEYPGENPGPDGDPALQQLLNGAYNMIPHSLPNTYQNTAGSVVSSQSLPPIKQEPDTCPPLPQLQPMVTVKQEPGVDPPSSCPSQSNASSQPQGYYQGYSDLSQTQNHSFDTNGSSSSLNGINGLFARFSSQGNYGVVKQTSSTGEKPVQFNDALCDILTEGSSFEYSSEPLVDKPDASKTSKKSKPRKQKSASSLDQSPPGQHSQSPLSHFVSQPNLSTSSSVPVCQPVPVYTHPAFTQAYPVNHSPSMLPIPPYTQSHMAMPPYTQAPPTQTGMPAFPPHPHVTQPSSFTSMMNMPFQPPPHNNQFSYMSQMPSMQGYPFQPPYPPQGQYTDPQGQYPGPQPPQAVSVKQEKPDD